MTDRKSSGTEFRRRFLGAQEPLFGSFIKTPSPHSIEILGGLGFDFVVIDAEHAPFDRGSTEISLLAARASGVAAIVRVASSAPEHLLAALDDGASGVIAPHITSAAKAQDLVAACRYAGRRGFSNSPRAGGYGARNIWQHVDMADKEVTVIAMIEDPEAIDDIDAILAVNGLDGVFVGRGDLAVALQDREPDTPQVRAATDRVIKATRQIGKPVCLLASGPAEAREFVACGVTAFVISSDQGFMRSAAASALKDYKSAASISQ